MRTDTDNLTQTMIRYPNEVMWINDINTITIESMIGMAVSAIVNLNINGTPYTLSYNSQLSNLTFRLNHIFNATAPASVTGNCIVTSNGQTHTYTIFSNGKIYFGKSFQERTHGCATVITHPGITSPNMLQLYVPAAGLINYSGNSINVTLEGIYNVTRGALPANTLTYAPNQPITYGEFFNENTVSIIRYDLRYICPKANFVTILYFDTDGCQRYAIGEVISTSNEVERDDFNRNFDLYKKVPQSFLKKHTGTIKVGFNDVEPSQYIEDIMFSKECSISTHQGVMHITPSTLSLERDGDTRDIIIKFLIDK